MGAHKLGQKTRLRWIKGQHGRYAVSGKGSVYSFVRGKKKLKPRRNEEGGHLMVVLYFDGVPVPRFVHKLVLETYVGPCPKGMVARHFPDRDPSNNRLENLQWGSRKENEEDKKVHGTYRSGDKHHLAKLTDDQVAFCRRIYQKYKKPLGTRGKNGTWVLLKLTKQFGVSRSLLAKVVQGRIR
jgi:HNH endonuclease